MNSMAQECGGQSVLLTFEPHPRLVIYGNTEVLHLLSTPAEKARLLEQAGVQNLIIHPFTKELAALSASAYINDLLVERLHVHTVLSGHDHRFGKNREGSTEDLKYWGRHLGFGVEEIEPLRLNGVTISSTKIRQAVSTGEMQTANSYLGYNYSLTAKVVRGMQIGATLGYPTANLEVADTEGKTPYSGYKKLIPADGVYAVRVYFEKAAYKGMMNIGTNPTIKDKGRSMEVHIFGFNSDIYNKLLTVEFISKIRDEEKFDNLEELKSQLDKDRDIVLTLMK